MTVGTVSAGKAGRREQGEGLLSRHRWLIPLGLVLLYFIIFSLLQPDVFLNPYNIKSLLLEYSIPVFVTIGMSIQLISGEIDLSVAHNVMFSNIFCGVMIMRGFPVVAAILFTIAVSSFIGFLAGLIVAKVQVNSFIASLAPSRTHGRSMTGASSSSRPCFRRPFTP